MKIQIKNITVNTKTYGNMEFKLIFDDQTRYETYDV